MKELLTTSQKYDKYNELEENIFQAEREYGRDGIQTLQAIAKFHYFKKANGWEDTKYD